MNSGVPAVLHSVSTLPSVAYTFIAELVAPIKYTVLDSASGRNGNVAVIVLVIREIRVVRFGRTVLSAYLLIADGGVERVLLFFVARRILHEHVMKIVVSDYVVADFVLCAIKHNAVAHRFYLFLASVHGHYKVFRSVGAHCLDNRARALLVAVLDVAHEINKRLSRSL